MIKTLQNLLTRSQGVKGEVVELANTATRIGALLEDLVNSAVLPFDAAVSYAQNQYAIVDGVLAQAVSDTNPGETPITHPLKWSVKLVLDPTQVTESNHLPVAASAVRTLIDHVELGGDPPPNATTETRGLAMQASDDLFELGESEDTYTTPKQVRGGYKAISDAIQKIIGISLDLALQGGADSAIMPVFEGGITAALPAVPDGVSTQAVVISSDGTMYAGNGTVVPPKPVVTYDFNQAVHFEAVPDGVVVATQPVFANKTPDWLITQTGTQTKVLEANEFTTNLAATYTKQAFYYDGGTQTRSPLPSWLTFDGATGKFTASITANLANTAFVVEVVIADQSGSEASDRFLLTLDVSTPAPTITRVAYAFQKNNPQIGQGGNFDVYVSTNTPLEMAQSGVGDSAGYSDLAFPKSAYFAFNDGSWQTVYNKHISTYNVFPHQIFTLYFRVPGTTVDILTLTVPAFPSADVPFTQIYPNSN